MNVRDLVDAACEDDPHARCLWLPSDMFPDFCAAIGHRPNRIGAVIYRNKTIRDGGPYCDITTRQP